MRATQRLHPGRGGPTGQASPFLTGPAVQSGAARAIPRRPALIEAGAAASLSQERRDLICSVIGLTVKLGLVVMAGVSLVRLAGAYQERMDRQGELAAVLELEQAKAAKARERFDTLFTVDGEQRLIREQNQWIAPNRLRVVWNRPSTATGSAADDGAQPARTNAAVERVATPATAP